MIEAKGYNGTVTFDGNFVTITRSGVLGRMSIGKGEKRIPLNSISAVQWKPPGRAVNGYICFTLAGGNEKKSRFGSQSFDAAKDENSVMVRKGKEADMLALRQAVEDAIAIRHGGQTSAAPAPSVSKLDQLKQLGELREAGVLSDEEFEAEKAKVLNRSE